MNSVLVYKYKMKQTVKKYICLLLNMNAINAIVLFFCVLQISAIPPHVLKKLPQEVVDMIHKHRGVCAPKFSLSEADIEAYDITNTEEKYKCYMRCMLLDSNWMSEDGTIHYERILEEIHNELKFYLEYAFTKCREIPDSTEECGKAYNFNVCMQKVDPVHYFLP